MAQFRKADQQPSAGGGGSQLKRLKKALGAAGLIGPNSKASISKKDRKKGLGKRDHKLKTALNEIQTAANPFELKVNQSSKVSALGRTIRGTSGRPGISKQVGIDARKKTLLVEMQNRGKTGGLVDRRFGEGDITLTPEEKMLERFTRERQRKAKGGRALFNLEDDDEDGEAGEFGLTHYGQSLAEMDDFDDAGLGLSDEDDDENKTSGKIDRDTVARMHFSGFEDTGNSDRTKSKAEVMKEVIAKSKMHKHERQLQRENDEKLRMALDSGLADIQGLIMSGKRESDDEHDSDYDSDAKPDTEYDRYVKELADEKRARPLDRIKTEEEKLMDEKARLEKAERHRLRRLQGLDSDTEPESDDEGEMGGVKRKTGSRKPQGDDLDDDFMADADEDATDEHRVRLPGLGSGLAEQDDSDEDEDEDDDDEDEDDDSEDDEDDEDEDGSEADFGSDWDADEAASDDEDDEDEDEDDGHVSKSAAASKLKRSAGSAADDDLPYTFAAPEDYDAFVQLVQGRTLAQQLTIIQRLRVLYHVKLSPQNKEHLGNILECLLTHLAVMADLPGILASASSADGEVSGRAFLDALVKNIGELSQQLPERFGQLGLALMAQFHHRLMRRIRSGSNKSALGDNEEAMFPSAGDLMTIKLLTQLFSSTDLVHPVLTPLSITMASYLNTVHASSTSDAMAGVFLCGVFHEMHRLSHRIVPETVTYLTGLVSAISGQVVAAPAFVNNASEFSLGTGSSVAADGKRRRAEAKSGLKSIDAQPLSFALLVSNSDESDDTEVSIQDKVSLLVAASKLALSFADSYRAIPGFIEMFTPLSEALAALTSSLTLSKSVSATLADCQSRLTAMLEDSSSRRRALQLQKHKAVSIPTFLPKFHESHSLDRKSYVSSNASEEVRQKAELNKLKHLHKNEMKSAIRELRKDALFVSTERIKETKRKDAEYNAMIKRIEGELATQEGEGKKMDKIRAKEKGKRA
ncbi:Nop14-like protein [Ramicandelaber brevisporus]|nr:Nop14-like protein [Ramicandelaber brevisporus]